MDLRTILLTTDLSPISGKAAGAAATLARKFQAKVLLAFVVDPILPHADRSSTAIDFEGIKKHALERARKQLASFAADQLADDVSVELVVRLGVPHVEIVDVAEERNVDLIVMAPHGRGFVSQAILGSTTERVLRRAPCPVLVVRHQPSA
jgi:nucleotide-binding universal stress UspA family protein